MPAPVFSVTYSDEQVRDRIERLQRKIGDLTPAMKEVGELMLLSTDQRFENEIAPSGTPWQRLSPRTIALKQQQGRIMKILQSTGLMRSRTSYRALSDRCIVGNNDVKARKHNLGIGVPRREFLGVSEEDRIEIVAILDDYLSY